MVDTAKECKTARTSQVTEQMQRLEKAIARMGEIEKRTEDRIGAILSSESPCGIEGSEKVKEVKEVIVVPLAGELKRLTDSIEEIANSMDYMAGRVEL